MWTASTPSTSITSTAKSTTSTSRASFRSSRFPAAMRARHGRSTTSGPILTRDSSNTSLRATRPINVLLSPIHFDTASESIPATEFMPAIEMALRQHGPPPFGTLLTGNPAPSTLLNWGDGSWVTLHQIGNSREHDFYWYLTQIFHAVFPQPALNGEPYYSGYNDARGRPAATSSAHRATPQRTTSSCAPACTAASFREAWPATFMDRRPSGARMSSHSAHQDVGRLPVESATQMQPSAHVRLLHRPALSRTSFPDADWVSPSKTQTTRGYEGWAYAAHTADGEIVLAYFEKGCPQSTIRALEPSSTCRAQWFDPRTGTWIDIAGGFVESSPIGVIQLPGFPGDSDWGLRLEYAGPAPRAPAH